MLVFWMPVSKPRMYIINLFILIVVLFRTNFLLVLVD